MTERTKSYSELLVNKDWKHRSFRDAAKEVAQAETLKAAWNIVPDERRRALFYLFRAAFLMGLSVEETLGRAFAETRSESSYTFDFGRNVDVDENLFDAYWMIWKLARSVSTSSTELAKYAWAFDSPELLLANSEFLSDAKTKWGDEVVDKFVSLALEPGSDVRRDMFAAFYRSRVKTPGLNVTVGFQANARFSGVLDCVEMYACKTLSDVLREYYYDMRTRSSVSREPSQERFASFLTRSLTSFSLSKAESADKEKRRENVKNLGLLYWIQRDERLADQVNAALLTDEGWMYRQFDDAAKSKLAELTDPDADWSLVSDAQRESFFLTFRAAFLLGYSVEEAIEQSVGGGRFNFGRRISDERLKILWPLWRIARASAPDFSASAEFAWAFDSPLSLLRDKEFSRRAKAGWGEGNFELLVELAAQQNENVLRDLYSSFKCARTNEAWGGSSSQETRRFRGVIDFMGGFASKKVSQTHVEYYYDIKTKQTITRNSSQEEVILPPFDVKYRAKAEQERAERNTPVAQKKKDAFNVASKRCRRSKKTAWYKEMDALNVALEVLRVVGLVLAGIIILPIAWILKVMFEPFFSEKEEKVYQKGEVRLVDRVYLDKEHGVVAEIYMRRD